MNTKKAIVKDGTAGANYYTIIIELKDTFHRIGVMLHCNMRAPRKGEDISDMIDQAVEEIRESQSAYLMFGRYDVIKWAADNGGRGLWHSSMGQRAIEEVIK